MGSARGEEKRSCVRELRKMKRSGGERERENPRGKVREELGEGGVWRNGEESGGIQGSHGCETFWGKIVTEGEGEMEGDREWWRWGSWGGCDGNGGRGGVWCGDGTLGSVGGSKAVAAALGRRQQLDQRQRGSKIGARRGGCRSPSLIFLEQPLEREFTPFFLQMTARVVGGPFPSYRAQNGPRGEREHLRPTI